jgi:hypothetical protein
MNENNNILKINLDNYLVDFVVSLSGAEKQPVPVTKKNFIGSLIYRLIDKVPEDCRFINPVLQGKRILELEISSLGFRNEERKRSLVHYYFKVLKIKLVFKMDSEILFTFV